MSLAFQAQPHPNALPHLRKADPIMKEIIATVGAIRPLKRSGTLFAHLCRVIIAQQVSVAAANTITARVIAACQGKLSPTAIIAAGMDRIRAAGCSQNKARFLHQLALGEHNGETKLRGLSRLPNHEVKARLCALHGIGPWSAEMVLMFRFGRQDIFSPGDIGIRRAMERGYNLPLDLDAKAWAACSESIAAKWAPYRSIACRYLWAWNDIDMIYEG